MKVESFEERLRKRGRIPVWQVDEEEDQLWRKKQTRMAEGKKRIDPGIMETLFLADLVDINRKHLELSQSKIPMNVPVYNELTLGGTDTMVHINFANPGNTVDAQRRQFKLPGRPLFSLDIKNDGNGDISVNWNHPAGDNYPVADVPVRKNEKLELRPGASPPGIEWVNLVATSSTSASLRLYGII